MRNYVNTFPLVVHLCVAIVWMSSAAISSWGICYVLVGPLVLIPGGNLLTLVCVDVVLPFGHVWVVMSVFFCFMLSCSRAFVTIMCGSGFCWFLLYVGRTGCVFCLISMSALSVGCEYVVLKRFILWCRILD